LRWYARAALPVHPLTAPSPLLAPLAPLAPLLGSTPLCPIRAPPATLAPSGCFALRFGEPRVRRGARRLSWMTSLPLLQSAASRRRRRCCSQLTVRPPRCGYHGTPSRPGADALPCPPCDGDEHARTHAGAHTRQRCVAVHCLPSPESTACCHRRRETVLAG
jgi:hypothetical protein